MTVYQEHTEIHSSVSITFIYLLLSICTVKEDLMWLPLEYNTSVKSDIVAFDGHRSKGAAFPSHRVIFPNLPELQICSLAVLFSVPSSIT